MNVKRDRKSKKSYFEVFTVLCPQMTVVWRFRRSGGGEAPLPRKLSADQEAEVVAVGPGKLMVF